MTVDLCQMPGCKLGGDPAQHVHETPGADMVSAETTERGPVIPHETSAPGPPVIEGPGRYKVFEAPDGGWVVARAVGICERCENCGCGEQADPIQVPGLVIQLATQNGTRGKLMGMLKAASGRG